MQFRNNAPDLKDGRPAVLDFPQVASINASLA